MHNRQCIQCAELFETTSPNKLCCTPECTKTRHLYTRRLRERPYDSRSLTCEKCRTPFVTRSHNKKYCSALCLAAATGKTHSQNNVDRMRLARYVLAFMERRMPEQLSRLQQSFEEKRCKIAQNAEGSSNLDSQIKCAAPENASILIL